MTTRTLKTKQKTARKKSKPERIKTISLNRGTIKDLSHTEKKKVRGGGGLSGGVVQGGRI